MEEENVLRFQPGELTVAGPVHSLPLPVRLEAVHYDFEMFGIRESVKQL